MSLFVCSQCGVIENTALTTGYWWNHCNGLPVLCSECKDGKWHGVFPRRVPEANACRVCFTNDNKRVGQCSNGLCPYRCDPVPALPAGANP